MNERIEKMMLEVGFICYGEENGEYTIPVNAFEYRVERLVKLIVQECAELCKKQEYDYWRSSEEQDYTPIDCANAIEEHFGVEE